MGDRSDGLPGVPGWGVTSAATLLRRYGCIDAIPPDPSEWDVTVRGAARLAASLAERRDEALLCRDLSILRTDLPLRDSVDDLQWNGAHRARLDSVCRLIEDDSALDRIQRWAR